MLWQGGGQNSHQQYLRLTTTKVKVIKFAECTKRSLAYRDKLLLFWRPTCSWRENLFADINVQHIVAGCQSRLTPILLATLDIQISKTFEQSNSETIVNRQSYINYPQTEKGISYFNAHHFAFGARDSWAPSPPKKNYGGEQLTASAAGRREPQWRHCPGALTPFLLGRRFLLAEKTPSEAVHGRARRPSSSCRRRCQLSSERQQRQVPATLP